MATYREHFAGERAEAPLHAVADDGVADFLGDGDAGAHLRVVVAAVADEEHEAGGRRAPAGVGGEEVGALLDYA